jgi:hypothetical protein
MPRDPPYAGVSRIRFDGSPGLPGLSDALARPPGEVLLLGRNLSPEKAKDAKAGAEREARCDRT